MSIMPRRLVLLEKKLLELPDDCEPMLLSQLDGYLAGIIVCPDLILPGEWLPLIWNTQSEDDVAAFDTAKQAEKLIDLVMQHYNATIVNLRAGCYEPVYDVDHRNGDIIWEMWMDGFELAMELRPESWGVYLGLDEETATALGGLLTLAEIANGNSELDQGNIDDLQGAAAAVIPQWIQVLKATRIARHSQNTSPVPVSARTPKIGRNDPCRCGSGKKYKKCCGLN